MIPSGLDPELSRILAEAVAAQERRRQNAIKGALGQKAAALLRRQGWVNAALNPSGLLSAQPGAQATNTAAKVSRRLQLPLAIGVYPSVKGLLE